MGKTYYWTVNLAALPLLGFSSKTLGFSIESLVLGFFPEGLRFFLGFFKHLGIFLGFFTFHQKNTIFPAQFSSVAR